MDEDEELQISFQSNEQKEIYEELQTIDINTLTPFEALSKLNRLINKAKGEK
jgi:hypothetical protein